MNKTLENKVRDFLEHSKNIQKVIKENFASTPYTFSYFEMDRKEFLDIFQVRLEISESKPDGRGMGNRVQGLRQLVQNAQKSSAKDKILCISITSEKNKNHYISIYTNISLTEIYGHIG